MTIAEKRTILKTFLENDAPSDDELNIYLDFAKNEILSYLYSLVVRPETVVDVPSQYEGTQIMAVVTGYNLRGAENQTSHSENGINRTFRYADMVAYIHSNVIPYARLI